MEKAQIQSSVRREILAQYILLISNLALPAALALLIYVFYGGAIYGRVAPLLSLCSLVSIVADFGAQFSAPLLFGALKSEKVALKRMRGLILFRVMLSLIIILPVGVLLSMLFLPAANALLAAALVLCAALAGGLSPSFYFYARRRMALYTGLVLRIKFIAVVALVLITSLRLDVSLLLLVYMSAPLLLASWGLRFLTETSREPVRTQLPLMRIMARRSWALSASAIAVNITVNLPFLLAARSLPVREIGWLHVGAMVSRAASSATEPLGQTLYSHIMINAAHSAASNLRRLQIGVGATITVIGWIVLELITNFSDELQLIWRVTQPMILLPSIIAISHVVAIGVLTNRNGRRRHLVANICGLTMCATGTSLAANLSVNSMLVAWVIVLSEVVVLAVLAAPQSCERSLFRGEL